MTHRFNVLAIILVFVLVFLAIAFALARPAHAHDQQMRESMVSDWMADLSSGKGLCCSAAEGATVKDVDWSTSDGMPCVLPPIDAAANAKPSKFCVRVDGVWWAVPENAVINEKNKYGPAVLWPIWGSKEGAPKTFDGIRCFLAGALS